MQLERWLLPKRVLAATWSVNIRPGSQLQRILVSGDTTQTVTFAGTSVPVTHYDTTGTWFGCGDTSSPGCNLAAMRAKAETAASTKATYFIGCPEMTSAIIN